MVLIEGMRGANSRMRVEPPLIVYKEQGVYSEEIAFGVCDEIRRRHKYVRKAVFVCDTDWKSRRYKRHIVLCVHWVRWI